MSQSSLESTSSALTLTPTAPEILYFAYAASSASLLALSPSSVPVGLAYLSGFTFALSPSGRANIAPVQQKSSAQLLTVPGKEGTPQGAGEEGTDWQGVYGLLYLVPEEDEPLLDATQETYEKTILEVDLFPPEPPKTEGSPVRVQVVRALVYLDTEAGGPGNPAEEHVKAVNDAIEEAVGWGMPEWYVERVRKFMPPDDGEKEETKAKEKRRVQVTG